jgi:trigger factor
MLPQVYAEIVKKEGLKPIINPKIDLLKAKENEDWQLRATVAERPSITLFDYRKLVKELKAEQKKSDIWIPGKDKTPEDEKTQEEQKRKLLDAILAALVQKSKVEIPDMIIEDEVNARLARLLDEVQKIGLTMDAYLKSKNLTAEQLRESFRREVEEVHKMEFILNEIADKENIQVEQKELDSIFAKITNEKEKKEAQANAYFYASIVRKQKTLDFLLNL